MIEKNRSEGASKSSVIDDRDAANGLEHFL